MASRNSKLTHLRSFSPPSLGVLAIGGPGKQGQPGGARPCGNHQHDPQQRKLGIKQPAITGGHQATVARVDHAVGDDDAGGNDAQHDGQGHGGEALERYCARGHRLFARLEQGVDAGNGFRLQAGVRRLFLLGFGAGKADGEEGGQGAKPYACHDDVQGVGQDRHDRELFGGRVAGKRAHRQGERCGSRAQDVFPARRGTVAQIAGNGEYHEATGSPRNPDLPHAGILHEGEPGIQPPGILTDAGGLGGGGGQDAHQSDEQDEAQPGQGALQAGDPG